MNLNLVVVVTGPRPASLGGCYKWKHKRRVALRKYILTLLENIIESNEDEKKFEFISGMALGTDIDAYSCFLEIKKKYKKKKIKIIAAIPFRKQYSKWSEDDKSRYFTFLDKADKIVYIDEDIEEYKLPESKDKKIISDKLKNRNKWMVKQLKNEKDILLAFPVKGKYKSGTVSCINYAKSKNKNIHITELDFNK